MRISTSQRAMSRFFAIYHGLTPAAPWGVAVERPSVRANDHKTGAPKVELLMLCRTEKEAVQFANLTSLGHGLKTYRDEKIAASEVRTAGAK